MRNVFRIMDTMDALRQRILFLEIQFLIMQQQQLPIRLENSKDNFLFFILKNEIDNINKNILCFCSEAFLIFVVFILVQNY